MLPQSFSVQANCVPLRMSRIALLLLVISFIGMTWAMTRDSEKEKREFEAFQRDVFRKIADDVNLQKRLGWSDVKSWFTDMWGKSKEELCKYLMGAIGRREAVDSQQFDY
ncbi:hypothetical protein Btru_062732 [Bulinus truncatus]|nr:hypothetical protein Btru_062732 [Bulinus truncatus]